MMRCPHKSAMIQLQCGNTTNPVHKVYNRRIMVLYTQSGRIIWLSFATEDMKK